MIELRPERSVLRLLSALPVAMVAIVLAAAPASAQGQSRQQFFQRRDFIDQRVRERLDADIPDQQLVFVEGGGYFIPQWHEYDDVGEKSNYRFLDLRLWGQVVVDDVHRVYARMRLSYTDFGAGDSPFGWEEDVAGPNLDQAFYELQLSRAVEKYCGAVWPVDVRLTLGRQFIEFGQGISLSQILDGGVIDVESGQWRTRLMMANSITTQDNIDRSPQVADYMDRQFYGFQFDLLTMTDHQPYLYAFYQNDSTRERPAEVPQDYEYNSGYIGLGSTGELVQNLRYGTEAIFEFGQSQKPLPGGRSNIRAFAFDQIFEYFFPGPHEPVASVEYILATGDQDRQFATDTLGGNMFGPDHAFLGFGYVNTGYAFAPVLTNLHVIRLGGRFKPLPMVECLKELELGLDFFGYWKHEKDAPISDPQADRAHHDLGHEIDLYANWRVFSDLSIFLRYARFWTDDAFTIDEKRDYAFAGMLISF